jgi:hypothetical protein
VPLWSLQGSTAEGTGGYFAEEDAATQLSAALAMQYRLRQATWQQCWLRYVVGHERHYIAP